MGSRNLIKAELRKKKAKKRFQLARYHHRKDRLNDGCKIFVRHEYISAHANYVIALSKFAHKLQYFRDE